MIRDERIFLRLSAEEKERIHEEARKNNLTLSAYIRYLCHQKKPLPVHHHRHRQIYYSAQAVIHKSQTVIDDFLHGGGRSWRADGERSSTELEATLSKLQSELKSLEAFVKEAITSSVSSSRRVS